MSDSPKSLFEMPFPEVNERGLRFSHSTYNKDGVLVATYKKDWTILGAWIIYEEHGDLCSCSYCEEFNGRWGITLPKCRCRNAWRVLWWRKRKFPCQMSCLRVTLPSFISWKCRFCRNAEKKGMVTTPTAKLRRF